MKFQIRYPITSIKQVTVSVGLVFVLSSSLSFVLSGCGYSLKGTKNPLLERAGIQKIYIASVVNNTYKAGIENILYNSLIKIMNANHQFTLVHHTEDADAILYSTIASATYVGMSGSPASQLSPGGIGVLPSVAGFAINTIYNATLTCSFSIAPTKPFNGKPVSLWSGTLSRSKPFSSANQLDVPGTTSPLINESEFERALTDLGSAIAADAHEKIIDVF